VLINHKSVDEAITSVGTQIKDIFKRVYGK
jgi:hypothetical protein